MSLALKNVLPDYKPLTMAFVKNKFTCSPMQLRHLDLISQFTKDVRHIKGEDNLPAYVLYRNIHSISGTDVIDYATIADPQASLTEFQEMLDNPTLKIQNISVHGTNISHNVSSNPHRPLIPQRFGIKSLFHYMDYHTLAAFYTHAGSKTTCASFLPIIFLGIRSALNDDLGFLSAEIVLGTTLRLPGEFMSTSTIPNSCTRRHFTIQLKEVMSQLKPVSPRETQIKENLRQSRFNGVVKPSYILNLTNDVEVPIAKKKTVQERIIPQPSRHWGEGI
ncbi:unnamed protein product [Lepeophtheirus salmonis]|uniref:(salmon louse) hypothetical protein n=1 Tax=Lepeophtheirus salmonis TaxID=72036 RepID=A0A7R8H1P4_LEPSM|nr:unnamed protein product [Lepeophtheirus salmonis]CAF2797618.1 unnamed protein product [Lepeophtheirus salmonis]